MSTVKEIQAAIPKLSRAEIEQIRQWIDDYLEERVELTDQIKAKLDQSRREIAAGQYTTRQPLTSDLWLLTSDGWPATFSAAFDSLPRSVREAIQHKVDEMGARLGDFPHKRLQGRPEFRLRVGDYRVLYEFDASVGPYLSALRRSPTRDL